MTNIAKAKFDSLKKLLPEAKAAVSTKLAEQKLKADLNVVGALGGFLLNRAGDVIKNNRTLDNVGVSFFPSGAGW